MYLATLCVVTQASQAFTEGSNRGTSDYWWLRKLPNEYPGVHKMMNVIPCAGSVMVFKFLAYGVRKPMEIRYNQSRFRQFRKCPLPDPRRFPDDV